MSRILSSFVIAVIAIAAVSVSLGADKTQSSAWSNKMQTAEKNYIIALRTGNEGAKVSAAGFIAGYRLMGGVAELINTLKSDPSESVRISAALALVMLDEPTGREAVNEASMYDGSDRVAQFCDTLLKAHVAKPATYAVE
jgi:hypothetical protein